MQFNKVWRVAYCLKW